MNREILTEMKRLFVCTILACILVPAANSQTKTADNSELAKSDQLARTVVNLFSKHQYAEALPAAKECLEIREKFLTLKDEKVRTALRNLGEIYIAVGKFGDAQRIFERLAKSYEQFDPTDPRLAEALQRLGYVYFAIGARDKAENAFERALRITESGTAPDVQRVAAAGSYLAEFYQAVGKYKKAEPVYRKILSLTENESTTPREDLQRTLQRYACLLRKTNREDEAQELEKRALPNVYGIGFVPPDRKPIIGGVLNGKALVLPKPPYPDEARAVMAKGIVVVHVVIDEQGKVIQACAIKGDPMLTRVSESAAYQSIFSPTKLMGQPVKVTGVITYNFVPR